MSSGDRINNAFPHRLLCIWKTFFQHKKISNHIENFTIYQETSYRKSNLKYFWHQRGDLGEQWGPEDQIGAVSTWFGTRTLGSCLTHALPHLVSTTTEVPPVAHVTFLLTTDSSDKPCPYVRRKSWNSRNSWKMLKTRNLRKTWKSWKTRKSWKSQFD